MRNDEKNELKSFMSGEQEPGRALDEKVLGEIGTQLKWLPSLTFAKALAAHWGAGLLTLSICPQFGWNPFGTSFHLPHIFMSYGMWACGLFCGSVFMALGALMAWLFLSPGERVYLSLRDWKYAAALSALSMGALMLVGQDNSGADIFFTESFIIFWVLGAFLFDWMTLNGLFSRYRTA